MPRYTVSAGSFTVTARSSVHDTTTTWDKITGTVEASPDDLAAARATFAVDMTSFDAGDWLKNRKLRSDFDMDKHPTATFELRGVRDVVRTGDTFTATAEGVLAWRGKQVPLTLAGTGKLDATAVEATAKFELDITTLGLKAPRFLMIKMSDAVAVSVTIRGAVPA